MPTLQDILDDKKGFPDDRKVTLADGVETTVGELRGGYMKERDYRDKTTKLARERDEFSQEKARFEQDKTEAEQQLAALVEKAVTRGAPPVQQQDEWQTYLDRDPVARRLASKLDEIEKKTTDLTTQFEARTKKFEEAVQRQEQAFMIDQHRRALAALKSRDPDLNEQDLVQFAKDNAIPRLDLAYRLMTEDKRLDARIKETEEKASKAAYEKAKRDLAQPMLPQRRVAPSLPAESPKTFEEAADAALRDPEILAIAEGREP